jgi:putative autoinducer-2 (AI-2) aldolase
MLRDLRTAVKGQVSASVFRCGARDLLVEMKTSERPVEEEAAMDWGMSNRLHRIIQSDGRTVMLAVDHGYFMGPTTGLEDLGATVGPLLPLADALMLTRGALRTGIPPEAANAVVLRVSGGSSILAINEGTWLESVNVDVEDCLRLNVCAMAVQVFIGDVGEKESLENLSHCVNLGERYGIPVLGVTAVGKQLTRDARYLALAGRIIAELGARLNKTYFCEGFEEVVEKVPVPIVVAGGKKTGEKEALQLASDAIQAGAIGVDMGRNIFQANSPVGMMKAIHAIVHHGSTVDEAFDIYLAEGRRP